MLLKQLKLQNIRSYIDGTIDFPSGSMLLAGDIGCGKSTILLAVEFALFGTSRPDLPGEALLRKGSSQGSVELLFSLGEQDVLIKRMLKKEKDTIKQVSGYILINGIKKELTPVELKAEVVSLLGYPEEFITKNKNYIFRYTIYTPQEEMKFILQESPEIRLDVLRKIFNVDKYKNVRENLQTHLKQMRSNKDILSMKIEPLEGFKQEQKDLQEEKLSLNLSLDQLTPKIRELKEKINENREELLALEKKQQQLNDFKNEYRTNLALITDKNDSQQKLLEQRETLHSEIEKFEMIDEEKVLEIKEEINLLEKQKRELYTQKNSLQEKVANLQQRITDLNQEIIKIEKDAAMIEEKEALKERLEKENSEREPLQQKHSQLEDLFDKTNHLITKNQTLLSHSQELQEKMSSLDNCPTCLQSVSLEHKHKISEQEESKVKQAENLLFELGKKRSEIYEQKEQTKERINILIKQENLLTRTKLELIYLSEKKGKLDVLKKQLQLLVQENNHNMNSLVELEKSNSVDDIDIKIKKLRGQLDSYSKQKMLSQQFKDLENQIKLTNGLISSIQEKIALLEDKISQSADYNNIIKEKKSFLELHLQEEKDLSIKQAQLQTQLNNINRQEEKASKVIAELTIVKNKLIRTQELYYWLEEHFLKLTYTIEKQVMVNLHHIFNSLFQEWFSMLIDDENVYSHLDDSFTPIIEQNGYEISFVNLSGGEKTSAALAYRLALNKVINDVVGQIKTKELLILDEPTDGFSSEQLDKVRDVLERLNLKQIIIVSHESKIESFVENVIRVNKQGHISYVS